MTNENEAVSKTTRSWGHNLVVLVIFVLVVAYTVGVLFGKIPSENRLDLVHLALIGITVIGLAWMLNPDLFSRVKRVETGSVNVELFEVKRELIAQKSEIDDIGHLLPLLLPKAERTHLINLYENKTRNYEGRGSLRAELRRLRSMGLIEMQPSHYVGHIVTGKSIDLAEYVRLTNSLGRYWARRVQEIEDGEDDENQESEE